MLRSKSASPSANLIPGRRVLALGASLAGLAEGPLKGAAVEMGSVPQLESLTPGAFDLIVIDADAWEAPALAAAIKALSALRVCPPVLMIGANLPAGLVRNLMRLDAADILESPYTPRAAGRRSPGPAGRRPAGRRRRDRRRGLPLLGRHRRGRRVGRDHHRHRDRPLPWPCSPARIAAVCLVDLNLADGAAAAYLGAAPTTRLADFGNAADRIDAAMLQAFVTPVSKGLDLMAGVRDPNAFDTVGREAVLRMLEVACEVYDWVILDVPRHRRSWTLEALAGCDEVLVDLRADRAGPAGRTRLIRRDRGLASAPACVRASC